jgi:2'-hydroxyisoflavone reductase
MRFSYGGLSIMKILVLGGTHFLGRHVVEAGRSRGHEVTLFNRGLTSPGLYADLETIRGDRDGGLDALRNRVWDSAIDTAGQLPRLVAASASLLAGSVRHYTFVSTLSVYADFSKPGMDESAPVLELSDPNNEEMTPEMYGPHKTECEREAQKAFPGRALILRPGLIVGPYDGTDRFTYWPHRIARGGEVLAPGRPDKQVAFIDARDLAVWMIHLIETEQTGVFNALGPDYPLTMQTVLETCRSVCNAEASFTWVSEKFLLEENVAPWTELPLWLPDQEEYTGFYNENISKALKSGLTFQPLSKTIQDTLDWDLPRQTDELKAGLSIEKEQQLLRKWRAITSSN